MRDVMKELLEESERETRFKSTLTNVRSMMRNLKLTAKQAMDVLEIPADEQKLYTELL